MVAEHRTIAITTRGNDHVVGLTTLEFEPGLVGHDMAAGLKPGDPLPGRTA